MVIKKTRDSVKDHRLSPIVVQGGGVKARISLYPKGSKSGISS